MRSPIPGFTQDIPARSLGALDFARASARIARPRGNFDAMSTECGLISGHHALIDAPIFPLVACATFPAGRWQRHRASGRGGEAEPGGLHPAGSSNRPSK